MANYLKSVEAYNKRKAKDPDHYDPNMEHYEACDVGSGSWIFVTHDIPISPAARPIRFGIYWGVPNEDAYGRQSCRIRTTEDIVLLNNEYTVVPEDRLKQYRENGWELSTVTNPKHEQKPLDLKLIEQGRSLVEEEREVIWALQLDGLNESAACEEYFFTRHTDDSNYTICYLPSEEIRAYFGI